MEEITMNLRLLHIFRNTPFGREVFLQSLYFCKHTGTLPTVFIPTTRQFLMYFKSNVVTVDLDNAFLRSPETARRHAEEIIKRAEFKPDFLEPESYTSGSIPVLSVDFRFMTCPRSISDLSTKIGLGYIGPKVRSIIRDSSFPILIPSPVYKGWKSITVFFGGSDNAVKALELGLEIKRHSGFPLQVFTQAENQPQSYYRDILEENDLYEPIEKKEIQWWFYDKGKLQENLYDVPHDSLVIVGAYGHGLVKRLVFGSKAELLQTVLPNNLLVVGPHYVSPSS
jgi:nucleotide-binding universal stress UspA family protein